MTALAPGFRVGCALVWLLLPACSDSRRNVDAAAPDDTPDAGVQKRLKPRTVSIELFKTAERVIETAADGSFQYGELIEMGDVKVCVAERRDAFAHFKPFTPLEKPICTMSTEGEPVLLEGVPTNSDLVITLTKDGFEPFTGTFRTDEDDVAGPQWSSSLSYPLWRNGTADPWREAKPARVAGNGGVILWVDAVDLYSSSLAFASEHEKPNPSAEQFCTHPINGVAPAEDVLVEIVDAKDRPVAELKSRRDRPFWVSLPAGLYRFRFSHPRFRMRAVGAVVRYPTTGLTTEAQETIEVPVLADRYSFAVVDALCDAPRGHGVQIQDLPTCTLTEPSDAGMP